MTTDVPELLVVTGMSGAGKTAVTASLDDLGWFVGSVTGPRGQYVFAGNANGKDINGPQLRKITEAILAERGIWPPPPPAPAP